MRVNKRNMPAREQVASMLRSHILNGTFHANQMLTLDEVAEMASCSRTPVREAFQMLAAEDLIELSPNRGAYVKEITTAFLEDHYWIREFLEMEAAARACNSRNRKMPIRAAVEKGSRAVKAGDIELFNLANTEFHTAIWDAADSPKLKSFLAQLWNGLSLDTAISTEESMRVIQRDHETIWQAIDNEYEDGARAAIKHHLDSSLKIVLRMIAKR